MVAQIASFTQIGVEYDVTIENGKAVNCTCPDRQYRNRTCKHMTNANTQVEMEIERAATFLALKAQYERQAPRYSQVCGHLVKKDIHRHCGCMA